MEDIRELLTEYAESEGLEARWWPCWGDNCFALESGEQSAAKMLAGLVLFAEGTDRLDILLPHLESVGASGCACDAVLYFPGVPAPEEEDELEEVEA